MAYLSLDSRDTYRFINPKKASGGLGPGSYDFKTSYELDPIKKSARSEGKSAFGSGGAKEINKLGNN